MGVKNCTLEIEFSAAPGSQVTHRKTFGMKIRGVVRYVVPLSA